jgi:Stress responsive A/B Barrel Domain
MLRTLTALLAASLLFAAVLSTSTAADEPGSQMAHMVFFTLKDSTPAAKQKLVAACRKYLSGHDGEVYFSTGARAEEMKRDVNDTTFDVALHIVFRDKASYDKYADAPRHHQFIDENKDGWAKVRVFDSWVGGK